MNKQAEIPVAAYSQKELADHYQVTVKTLRTWLAPIEKEIGERRGWYFTPLQVAVIFEKLGNPVLVSSDEK